MSFPLRTRTRGRPGRGAGVKSVAAAPSFNPLTSWTTDPVHGVWASDPLWVPPADGGAVSSWRNGGSVGGDLVQATGSKQPTYDAVNAAYNNQPTVYFTTDDVLAVDVADIAQPYYIVAIGNDSTSVDGRLVGVGGAASGNGIGNVGVFVWMLRAGSPATGGGTPDANPHVLYGEFDGTNRLFVDGSLVWSVGGTQALAVLSLGAGNTGVGTYGNHITGNLALVLVFTTDPTALPEWAAFKAWVLTTYGITIA